MLPGDPTHGGGGETEDGTIHACIHTYIQYIQTPCFAVPRKVSAEAEVQRLPGAFRNECRGIRN